MTPELLEIDGQLFGGIVREDSDGITSCSCHLFKGVRVPGFRFVAVGVAESEPTRDREILDLEMLYHKPEGLLRITEVEPPKQVKKFWQVWK